jgi:hypothetical protein
MIMSSVKHVSQPASGEGVLESGVPVLIGTVARWSVAR